MRVKNSLINITTGLGSQVIITLLSFISRTVFITYLGVEYLGINGLFTNVLGMLSLAEAGIGSAIIFNLYKPVAENDIQKINMLINFYKKVYRVIASVVFILGLSFLPFLDLFVKEANIENVGLIYILFLTNTAASYLFTHKISFLNVSQKGYVVTSVYSISTVIATFVKIGVLHYTGNFILYLVIDILITIITSIVLSILVDKMYPFLKNRVAVNLDPETKNNIIKNVKSIVLHKIGGYAVFGTDNLIIASFVSVAAVGLYSNYYMLINISRTLINQVFNNINYSVGNLVAIESDEKIYSFFKVMMLFNYWIYSFFTITLFVIIQPFIVLWLGNDFLMSKGILLILMINFFVSGMRRSISMVKSTAGIFHEDRYAPFFEAGVNLVASIILVQYLGIVGVFIGTLISTLLVPFWVAPYLVYKNVFKQPVRYYFYKYIYFVILGTGTCFLTYVISNFFNDGWNSLFIKGLICLFVPNLVYLVMFYRTEEFKYLSIVFSNTIMKLLSIRKYRKNKLEA
jgi:O-antigen/teichoic acid export membrane protein